MSAADVHNHSTYTNRGCRCEVCRAAQAAYMREYKSRIFLMPGDSRHGTDNGYNNYGCRCAKCRAARSEYRSRRAKS